MMLWRSQLRGWKPGVEISALIIVCCLSIFWTGGCDQADADATGKPVRLELWTLALRPTFNDYMAERIAAFEAENPGVKVDWVDVPFDAVSRKLIAAAAAGRAPDVINLSDMQFSRFAALGALTDLAPLLPGDATGRYVAGPLAVGRLDGTQFALPWYLTTQTKLMNTALLAEAGLSPGDVASDWGGLRAQARAFHEKTGKYLFSVALGHDSDLPAMMLADGLMPLRPRVSGEGLESNLDDPAIVAFVRQWVELYRDGALPREAATTGFAHVMEGYQGGRVAVINTGALSKIKDASPAVYAATQVGPAVTGSLGRAHIAVMLVGVTSQSSNPELSARLAWSLTGPEAQMALCRQVSVLPSVASLLNDPHFAMPADASGLESKVNVARAEAARQLTRAVAFTPSLGTWPDMRSVFNEKIKSALLAGRDVEAVLGEIGIEWNRILGEAIPASMASLPSPAATGSDGPEAGGTP